jgi:hypothetical protein
MTTPQFVINPQTGRYVKVGSRAFKDAERATLSNDGKKTVAKTVFQTQDKEELVKTRKNLKTDNPNKTLKIHKDKIITVTKRKNMSEYRDKIVDIGAKVLTNTDPNEICDLTDEEMQQYFKQRLFSHLAGHTESPPKNKMNSNQNNNGMDFELEN